MREPTGASRTDAQAGDVDWLAQVAGELHRLQKRSVSLVTAALVIARAVNILK